MNKAFTLIELIAVIAILGIILVIIMPVMTNTLNKAKEDLNTEQVNMLEKSARNWGVENASQKIDTNTHKGYVTIKELQDSGYLEDSSVKNLTTKTDLNLESKICITYENNQYTYTYQGGDC